MTAGILIVVFNTVMAVAVVFLAVLAGGLIAWLAIPLVAMFAAVAAGHALATLKVVRRGGSR